MEEITATYTVPILETGPRTRIRHNQGERQKEVISEGPLRSLFRKPRKKRKNRTSPQAERVMGGGVMAHQGLLSSGKPDVAKAFGRRKESLKLSSLQENPKTKR